jgi:Lrp/AsnC family leucine-responsive transcriptional regulator
MLDATDLLLLERLQSDGRRSVADLAREVDLAPATVHGRVRRLEADGVIKATAAVLDADRLGFSLPCFIHVELAPHRADVVAAFRVAVAAVPEVLECHSVTGDVDYVLKVVARDRAHLAELTAGRLAALPGVARLRTSVVLETVKQTTALPLAPTPGVQP